MKTAAVPAVILSADCRARGSEHGRARAAESGAHVGAFARLEKDDADQETGRR
jgi:hypothetical protein